MSIRLTLAGDSPARSRSWLLRVDDATTVGEVAQSLDVDPASLGADAAATLAAADIRNGALLPPTASAIAPGTPRLEVVGGPFAGESAPLVAGETLRIGSGGVELRFADPYLLETHATLLFGDAAEAVPGRPAPLAATIAPLSADGPVIVNGERIEGPTRVVPADLVQIGSSVLRLGITPGSDADIAPTELGMRGFNRPSRIRPGQPTPVLELPGDKPENLDKSPLPWLSAVMPVVLGVTMAVLFGRAVMLIMAAASPIMVVGSYLNNRRLAKKKGERTEATWIQEVHDAEDKVARLVREQRLDGWYADPDPVVVRDLTTRPMARLWERRKTDRDALRLRVGVTELDLDVRYEGGPAKGRDDRRVGVSPVPVAADLAAGVVGVAGPSDAARSTARAMLTSIVALRSPRDLQVLVLCDDDAQSEWAWTQWLPHSQAGAGVVSMIGNTDDSRRERLRELVRLLEARQRAGGQPGGAGFDSHVLLVVDGARRYRTLPGMVQVLEHGAAVGIHVLAIDDDRARLPEEARSVVVIEGGDRSLGRLETGDAYHGTVLLDGVSLPAAERIARALCSIEHVSGVGDEGMLPTSVRYAELLDIDLDDPEPIVRRWEATPRRSFVVVGANADGEFALDIANDGPHALVAGTTGSGKSEFLQALVVSLALANRPDALNFVLVDYKGGSAFADCERLPHTVGMVTNLDARETERALASLDAELKRRERVLRELAAKDVDQAWAKDPEASARRGLARLMIVIDEFAELKTELPEFIDGLVRIARVGRSLGVNLVLATQRPAGVVTPEMQSNINLRVALRVTDRSDSTDVLGSQEAALIGPNTPGRGYVRAGANAAPMPFQTARVAGVRLGTQRTVATLPPKAPIEWGSLGSAPRFPSVAGPGAPTDHDDTDLRALVNLALGATRMMGIPKNPSPWLLPLPEIVTLDRFEDEQVPDGSLVLGLEDVPGDQQQVLRGWNLAKDSHLLFFGGALSGRTSALRTLLAQAVQRFTPADLHLYIADYGNGALLPLADAPHCGAVVTPLDQERLPRLVERLLADLSRRQHVLSQAGVANIAEQRRLAEPADALPYAIFVVDGWERLGSTMNPDQLIAFRDQFMRVLREGPAAGIRVFLTGDRSIPGDKVASFIDTQYAMPMRDVNDYRAAGIMLREAPAVVPGRALFGGGATEAQVAVLTRDTSGEAQTAAFRAIVEYVRDHFDAYPQLAGLPRPFRVDPLPSYIALSAAYELRQHPSTAAPSPVLGVGGDELARFTLDWPATGGFVVVGPRGSGRSSTLASLTHQLAHGGQPIVVVAPKASVLTEIAAEYGIAVLSAADTDPPTLQAAVEAAAATKPGTRVTIVVDDADALRQAPIEHALTGLATTVDFVVASETEASSQLFGGAFVQAKKARAALVLSPTNAMVGTQLAGLQVPKYMLGARTPGGGVLHLAGEWHPVRVPDLRQ